MNLNMLDWPHLTFVFKISAIKRGRRRGGRWGVLTNTRSVQLNVEAGRTGASKRTNRIGARVRTRVQVAVTFVNIWKKTISKCRTAPLHMFRRHITVLGLKIFTHKKLHKEIRNIFSKRTIK